MYDPGSQRPRGFGFVIFAHEEALAACLSRGSRHELHSKFIDVKRATPRGASAPPVRSFHQQIPHGGGPMGGGMGGGPMGGGMGGGPMGGGGMGGGPMGGGGMGGGMMGGMGGGMMGGGGGAGAGGSEAGDFNPLKCFIGGVPHSVDEGTFRAYFSQFGEVLESWLMYDPGSQVIAC